MWYEKSCGYLNDPSMPSTKNGLVPLLWNPTNILTNLPACSSLVSG